MFPALTLPTGSPGGPTLEGESTTFAEQAAAEAERPQSERLGDHDLDPRSPAVRLSTWIAGPCSLYGLGCLELRLGAWTQGQFKMTLRNQCHAR